MSLDNDGEGGILAVMSLVGIKKHRPLIVAIGLLGAALIYGDGAVTPAISVLSALEGLNIVTPALQSYVLPATVVILVALFAMHCLRAALTMPTVRQLRILEPFVLLMAEARRGSIYPCALLSPATVWVADGKIRAGHRIRPSPRSQPGSSEGRRRGLEPRPTR